MDEHLRSFAATPDEEAEKMFFAHMLRAGRRIEVGAVVDAAVGETACAVDQELTKRIADATADGTEIVIHSRGEIVDEPGAARVIVGTLLDITEQHEALAAVQRISCNDASALEVGQAQYSGLLTPEGTFVDDLLVYRMASSHFMLVANASNVKKDFAWISEHLSAVRVQTEVTPDHHAGLALPLAWDRDLLDML